MLGLWRTPGAPGGGPGGDRARNRAEVCVPETRSAHPTGGWLTSPAVLITDGGASHTPGVGLVLGGGAWEGVRGSPPGPVLPPALAPSSPAHSCPAFAPCATAQTCTSPGWRLGGDTQSHNAGGCPGVGWRGEGDPRVKEPGPRVRTLGRGRGAQLATHLTWGQSVPNTGLNEPICQMGRGGSPVPGRGPRWGSQTHFNELHVELGVLLHVLQQVSVECLHLGWGSGQRGLGSPTIPRSRIPCTAHSDLLPTMFLTHRVSAQPSEKWA